MYSLEDFGIYAIFYALVSILGGVSSLSLQNATLIEQPGDDSILSTIVALTITLGFSTLLLVAVFVIPSEFQRIILGDNVLPFLFWLPFSVMVSGSFNCVYTWAVRSDLFDILACNKLILGVSIMFLQIGIGLMDPGAIGFIIANLIGQSLALLLLGSYFCRDIWREQRTVKIHKFAVFLRKHSNLIVWTTPASLVNYISSFLPDILINKIFGSALLGQYSLANRMVNFPLAFLATGLQDIFRQQAAEEIDLRGNCRDSFNRFFFFWLCWFQQVLLFQLQS